MKDVRISKDNRAMQDENQRNYMFHLPYLHMLDICDHLLQHLLNSAGQHSVNINACCVKVQNMKVAAILKQHHWHVSLIMNFNLIIHKMMRRDQTALYEWADGHQ